MKLYKVKDKNELGALVGKLILEDLKKNPKLVLGLPTGASPLTAYDYLIKDYKKNKTDWSKTTFFNLDEYVGFDKSNPKSYFQFMRKHFFNEMNIKEEQTFIPIGIKDYLDYAKKYDDLMKKHGGLDVQLLSLGRNGHIAFNEPGSDFKSRTRVVKLTESTIKDHAHFFNNSVDEVPKEAISMGIQSIMDAKKIIVIANGESKQFAIKNLIEGKQDKNIPCTVLQNHKNLIIVIDNEAAKLLKNK